MLSQRALASRLVRVSGALALAGLTLVVGFNACTTFDGLKAAPEPVVPKDSGSPDKIDVVVVPEAAVEAEAGGLPRGYLSTSDAVKLCALVFKCPKLARSLIESSGVPIDSSNFSQCVDWLTGAVDPGRIGFTTQLGVLECAAKATTCLAAGQCTSVEFLVPGDPRCLDASVPETGTWSVACGEDGGAIYYCAEKADSVIYRCTGSSYDSKSRCMAGNEGILTCALDNTCPGPTCEGTYFYDTCSTSSLLHVRFNCSATGQTCGQDDAGYVGCITGQVFDECNLYAVKCAGARVQVCDGVYHSYFDCTALGGTCTDKNGMPRCTRAVETCNPGDSNSVICTGNNISLCVNGSPVSFDCSSVGLTCKPGSPPLTASCG